MLYKFCSVCQRPIFTCLNTFASIKNGKCILYYHIKCYNNLVINKI